MAIFGLEVLEEEAHAKITDIRTRLLVDNLVKNPFTARIIIRGKDFYVVDITPVYPAVHYFALFPALIWVVFPYTWWGIVSAVISGLMCLLGLWWWDRFYYFLFWLATKKGVKYVSAREALRRVV